MLGTPRGYRGIVLTTITAILLGPGAIAQTNAPAKDQKTAAPVASEDQVPSPILSETMGADFGPYLKHAVLPKVRESWCQIIPDSAKRERATVTIDFVIMKDGTVGGMTLLRRSGDVALDRAAWGGIVGSNPFSPLPEEFKGPHLDLRLSFYYNPNQRDIDYDAIRTGCGSNAALTITPSSPVGTSVQFSASANERKTTTPAVSSEDRGESTPPAPLVSMGVDFGPYIKNGVLPSVRQHWCALVPESAKGKKATVAIEFAILKDGSLAGIRLAKSSGDVALDRAAWGGITASNPFSPLPDEFKGPYLALRFSFYYNPLPGEIKDDATGIRCGSDGALNSALPDPVKTATPTPAIVAPKDPSK